MLRPHLAAAAAVAVAALLVALPASAADEPAPQDVVSFGISPAGPERPDDRPVLSFDAPPGAVVQEHAAVLNQDDVPIALQVYGGDVVMADGGGLAVRPRDVPSTDAGAWITLTGPTSVEVPAQTAQSGLGYTIVPFTVTIPTNAEPGDHVAALVASLESVGTGGADAPSIALDQRVAARVYVRVDGPLDPGLAVTGVDATWSGGLVGTGTVTVGYTLRNTGNVRMAVEPVIGVSGPFGLLRTEAQGTRVDELPPGGEVRMTTEVPGAWPLVLDAVTVSATAVAPASGVDPGVGTVTEGTRVWAVPWLALAVLVLAAALLVVHRVRRRARRVPPAPPVAPAAPEPVGAGAR